MFPKVLNDKIVHAHVRACVCVCVLGVGTLQSPLTLKWSEVMGLCRVLMDDMVISSTLPGPFDLLSPCFISAVTFLAQKMRVKAFSIFF